MAASGRGGFNSHESSGGRIIKAVSATRQFYNAKDRLCKMADYVAGITEHASSLTHHYTIDAKPYKDSNSANIRL